MLILNYWFRELLHNIENCKQTIYNIHFICVSNRVNLIIYLINHTRYFLTKKTEKLVFYTEEIYKKMLSY